VKTIWTTQCILANAIQLYQEDWDHIVEGHPEMQGKEQLVKTAVENPLYIQEAGNAASAAYVLAPDADNPEGVRVIVGFNSEMWVSGNKIGDVRTGYPINSTAYANPDLGKIIWQSNKGGVI
jgi:hypothetical protein